MTNQNNSLYTCSLILILMLVSAQLANAQSYVDLLKVNHNNTSQNNFENSGVTTIIAETDLELTLPLAINTQTNFLTGFIFEKIDTKLFEDETRESFSSISLKLGMNKIHSKKWSGTYVLLPKISSDFEHLNKRDFQIGVFALLKYKKNERASLKVGLYTNAELFGPWVVPLWGIYYLSPSNQFEVNVVAPFLADFNYKVHRNVGVGLNYAGQVRTYHLNQVSTTGSSGYVERATNEITAYLKFNLTKSLILQTKVGHSIGRHYRVYDDNDRVSIGFPLVLIGDDRQQLNTDREDGWVYQFILLYRFRKL